MRSRYLPLQRSPLACTLSVALFVIALILPASGQAASSNLFQDAKVFRVGAINTSVAVGDFNSDKIPDLAVGDQNGGVNVLLGKGNGSFGRPVNYTVGNTPEVVVAGDFNHDGKLDLAVANFGDNTVSILLGNGDGTFQTSRAFSAGSGPFFIATGDFNKDGNLDLAVTNNGGAGNTISVLLGNGNGTFQAPLSARVGAFPAYIAVADVNGDGNFDAVVANEGSSSVPGTTVSVLLGTGNGGFLPALDFKVGPQPTGIAIGDFNKDGKLDLAVSNFYNSTLSILLGSGNGSFVADATYPTGAAPNSVLALDEGGGKLDLIVGYNAGLVIMRSEGDGKFGAPRLYGPSGYYLVAGDFNQDGIPDLASVSLPYNGVAIFLGLGDGDFKAERFYDTGHLGVPVGNAPLAVAAGDLNHDGILDLIAVNSQFGLISVFLGGKRGSFRPAVNSTVGNTLWSVAVGDFNGDGNLDLAVGNEDQTGKGSIEILLGHGDGTFQAPISTPVGKWNVTPVVADVNGDGHLDLVFADLASKTIFVLLGKGNGSFQAPVSYDAGQASAIAAGDLNGDGRIDLVATQGDFTVGHVSVLLGKGDGTFGVPISYATGPYPSDPVLGDFTGDGKLDISVMSGNTTATDTLAVFPGNGDGTFATAIRTASLLNGQSLVEADFNGDGLLDVAVNYSTNSGSGVALFLGKGNGRFAAQQTVLTGGNPLRMAVGDFNQDGAPDLAVPNSYDDTVSVLLNSDLH